MKFFGAVILFLIAFLVIAIMIALVYLRKLFMRLKQYVTGDYDEETFRRMSDKYYKNGEGTKFDKDYFKGTGSSRQYYGNQQSRERSQGSKRTTTTASGVTIIDERPREETQRKIFTPDEGEYVDFIEEKD